MSTEDTAPANARPTAEQVAAALERAAAHRRACHRADPRFTHYTRAALEEQVVPLPERPLRMGAGWWCVGVVLDTLADEELLVRLHPATGRVQTAPISRPAPSPGAPRPPEGADADELRRRWVKRWE